MQKIYKSKKKNNIIGAILLVSGTSIGGGMLVQPATAGVIGFIPTIIILLISWLFMTSTGLILAEVCMYFKKDIHIVGISEKLLGKIGKIITILIYLFMAYASLVAYIAGGSDLLNKIIGIEYSEIFSCIIFTTIIGSIFFLKDKTITLLNILLFIGLIISYLIIIVKGLSYIKINTLLSNNINTYFIYSIPLFLTGFSFQMIIPSLANYLQRDSKKLRYSIFLGTSLTLIIYILWNIVILSLMSTHESTIIGYNDGRMPIYNIKSIGLWFYTSIHCFSLFALATSFLGLAWGLMGFFSDWMKLRKKKYILLLVFIGPMVIANYNRDLFISAIEATGAYGDTLLNGIIPILMYWVIKRMNKINIKNISYIMILKKVYIWILLFFASIVIIIELYQLLLKIL